jgi:hypothetical protein
MYGVARGLYKKARLPLSAELTKKLLLPKNKHAQIKHELKN